MQHNVPSSIPSRSLDMILSLHIFIELVSIKIYKNQESLQAVT